MAKPKKIKKKDAIVSKVSVLLIVVVLLIAVTMLAGTFLRESGYFKLRTVDIKASFLDPRSGAFISNRILNAYKAKNVFSINLKNIAKYIQNSYGDVRDVVVRISLPDKLVISLKLRQPVALIKSGKFYPVDEDGVVLPGGSRTDALNDLPIVSGVEIRALSSRLVYRKLKLALELLGEIRLTRSLASLGVASINAYDPRNLSFSLKNGVEIRIGEENLRERLDLLSKALRDPRLVLENVKYIDVRFKDIIIGPK